jgi:hypothetical protein
MHPYLPHLLADIKTACRTKIPEEVLPTTFEEEMEEIERWVAGEEPAHTFGYYCGLHPGDFPPASQLSTKDMRMVCKAFHDMMATWNLDADFPKKLPLPIRYTMLIQTLDEKTDIPNHGFMSFDYCSGSPEGCVFGVYCSCIELAKKWAERNAKGEPLEPDDGAELPF